MAIWCFELVVLSGIEVLASDKADEFLGAFFLGHFGRYSSANISTEDRF